MDGATAFLTDLSIFTPKNEAHVLLYQGSEARLTIDSGFGAIRIGGRCLRVKEINIISVPQKGQSSIVQYNVRNHTLNKMQGIKYNVLGAH
jgi:hypothetical protein